VRILIESIGFGVGDNLGGSARVSGILARAIAARGHDVWFVCTDIIDKHSRLGDGGRQVDRDGVHVVYCNTHTLPFWPGVLGPHYSRIPSALPAISSFDIVHLSEFRSHLASRVGTAALSSRVPLLLQPHGTFLRHQRSRGIKLVYDRLWGRRISAGATRVLAGSRAEAASLVDADIRAERIRIVPNPIDLDTVPAGRRGDFRRRVGVAPDVPMILSVGRLDAVKGFDLMIAGLAEVPAPAVYVIAGPDHGYGATLRRVASDSGFADRVFFAGALRSTAEVLAAMADADVVALPSRHENFGQVILEALLVRRPLVVSTGCHAAPDFDGRGAVLAAPEPRALGIECRKLVEDATLRGRLADAGAALLEGQYSTRAVAATLEAVYREVVSVP
jgi:glycosyltransferase involved in cell wall biosynthesis